MPRRTTRKTTPDTVVDTEVVSEVETKNVVRDENQHEKTPDLEHPSTGIDAVDRLKLLVGEGGSYVQIEVRRLGDPPQGGYIGRMQFATSESIDELPERIAEQYGGGIYQVQLLKCRVNGAMRYSSQRFEIAIGGSSLPISRKTKKPTQMMGAEEFGGMQNNSYDAHNRSIPFQNAPVHGQGFSIEQVLEFAKMLQNGNEMPLESILKLFSHLSKNGAPSAQVANDPFSSMERMLSMLEVLRKFDSQNFSRNFSEEDDEFDLLSGKGLNKIIGLAALKMMGGGAAGAGIPGFGAQSPTPSKPPGPVSPQLPKRPDLPGQWAFMPESGWVRVDNIDPMWDDDDFSETENGVNLASGGGSEHMSPEVMSQHIKNLPDDQREQFITKLSASLFNIDEQVVSNFVSNKADDVVRNATNKK